MEQSMASNRKARKDKGTLEIAAITPTLVPESVTTDTKEPVLNIVRADEPMANEPNSAEAAIIEFTGKFGNMTTSQTLVTPEYPENANQVSSDRVFIEANTCGATLFELKENHIIPVFIKDNEPVISQVDFIETTAEVMACYYPGELILKPNIRLSHPLKGRVPEAKNKPASQLLEHEKTLYYERMAFVIEVPSISADIDGNKLSLCIGGVKAYNLDNLYNKKGADEHFKIFIGFQNLVCTNLCISTDGYKGDLRVTSLGELQSCLKVLLENYNAAYNIQTLKAFAEYSLTEQQFAKLIGRCRMYNHLPKQMQSNIPSLLFGDTQVGLVVKDYFSNKSFCKNADGTISLWKLYNLFTGANKSSYIDNFLSRGVNAFQFIYALKMALDGQQGNWFLL